MKENYTHLSILVDRSGSMTRLADEASNGINSLIKEQAELPGKITVSLYQFDTVYEKVFGPLKAKDAPKYQLEARGMTALLDSAQKAIVDTGEFLRDLPEEKRPSKVLFAIVTDGAENSSREITREQLKSSIKHQENVYNWEFVFLGANVDAFGEAAALGVGSSIQYVSTADSVAGSYNLLSTAVASSRTTGSTLKSFTANNNTVDESGKVRKSPKRK